MAIRAPCWSSRAILMFLGIITPAWTVGTAHVVNNCAFPVWYASTPQNVDVTLAPLPKGDWSEAYRLNGVGISIKVATAASLDVVTQFEYTWADGKINYDLSNIDGNPFAPYGMALTPATGSADHYPTCTEVNCPPCRNLTGTCSCDAAYNHPDDVRTLVCDENTDLTMTLCLDQPTIRSVKMAVPHGPPSYNITSRHLRGHGPRRYAYRR